MLGHVDVAGAELRLREPQDRPAHLRGDHRIAQQAALKQPPDAAVKLADVDVVVTGDLGHG